jgi:hypothetical protein
MIEGDAPKTIAGTLWNTLTSKGKRGLTRIQSFVLFEEQYANSSTYGLLYWDRRHRHLVFLLTSMFAILITMGIHGFSTAEWHYYIDGSKSSEVLLGKTQSIRTDDWMGNMPNVFAQIRHDPPFPVVNKNIGTGQNMLFYPQMPVAHPLMIFRPNSWGYFLAADFGMAWQWFARLFGLFYSFFLVFLIVSQGRFWLAVSASALFAFSPFIQFWAMNSVDMLAYLAFSIVSAYVVLYSKSWQHLLISGIALTWSGGCFLLALYPPFQIPLGYAFFAILATLLLIKSDFERLCFHRGLKAFVLLLSIAALALSAFWFFKETREVIETMLNTAYPGKRSIAGGDQKVWEMFSNSFDFFNHRKSVLRFGNICESASFYFIFPLAIVLWALYAGGKRQVLAGIPMLLITIFLIGWGIFGFPEDISEVTFMNMVQPKRSVIALGVVNVIWLVWSFSQDERRQRRWPTAGVLTFLWVLLIYAVGMTFREATGLPIRYINWAVLFAAIVGFGFALRKQQVVTFLAIVQISVSIKFNPLAKGFSGYLLLNPLSQKMTEIAAENPRGRWTVFQSLIMAQLPKMIGLPSIGGQQYYPDMALWNSIDPDGHQSSAYNRFGYVTFSPDGIEVPKITNPSQDVVRVATNPGSQLLRNLNIDFALVVGDQRYFENASNTWSKVADFDDKSIYSRNELREKRF